MEQWGELWQVTLAHEKTQAMVPGPRAPSMQSQDSCFLEARICHSRITSRFWACLWTVAVARQTSLRVSALRRVVNTLYARGILTLYREQMHPCMDSGSLSWMSSRYPLAETGCSAAVSPATGGQREGPAGASTGDVTGVPSGCDGTIGVPQDSGAEGFSP